MDKYNVRSFRPPVLNGITLSKRRLTSKQQQQTDPLVPFYEISVCLPPLGVSFPRTWDPRERLWSHAGHTPI